MARNKGEKELEELSFKPAVGGLVSTTRHKVYRGGQGGGGDYDYEHGKPVLHPTHEHAAAHLLAMTGHVYKDEGPTKMEGAEMKKQTAADHEG